MKRWTEKDVTRLIGMREAGLSSKTIAEQLGRSKSAIVTRLSMLGVPAIKVKKAWTAAELRKVREFRQLGMKPAEIAAKLGRSVSSVNTAASDHGISTRAEYDPVKVIALYKKGKSWKAIANYFGASVEQVRASFYKSPAKTNAMKARYANK